MTYPFRRVVRTSFSTGHWLIPCTVNRVLYTLEQSTPSENKKQQHQQQQQKQKNGNLFCSILMVLVLYLKKSPYGT